MRHSEDPVGQGRALGDPEETDVSSGGSVAGQGLRVSFKFHVAIVYPTGVA